MIGIVTDDEILIQDLPFAEDESIISTIILCQFGPLVLNGARECVDQRKRSTQSKNGDAEIECEACNRVVGTKG